TSGSTSTRSTRRANTAARRSPAGAMPWPTSRAVPGWKTWPRCTAESEKARKRESMHRRASGWLLNLMLVLTLPLAGQGSEAPWRLSYFPYLTVSPNDGLMGMARAIWFRQAEWGDRVTLDNSVAVEAGYSTRDAWLARATWANPRLAPGWRIKAHAEVGHQGHFGDPDASLERDHARAWVDVSRQLQGPLHLAVRGGARKESLGELDLPDYDTDFTLRGALVADLRDREFEVNRGALLEGGLILGTGGREGYSALYTHLRGWYNPLP